MYIYISSYPLPLLRKIATEAIKETKYPVAIFSSFLSLTKKSNTFFNIVLLTKIYAYLFLLYSPLLEIATEAIKGTKYPVATDTNPIKISLSPCRVTSTNREAVAQQYIYIDCCGQL